MALTADPLRANGEEIHVLASFISSTQDLERVPDAFIRVMKSGSWQHWKNELGREVKPSDFRHFVEAPYPSGLGTTLDTLRKLIDGNAQAIDLYDRAMQRGPGEHTGNQYTAANGNNDNIMNSNTPKSEQGTSATYALRRLRRERPDLHKQVIEGEKSAHSAAVEAGFRKKYVQVEPTPEAVEKFLERHLPGYRLVKDE